MANNKKQPDIYAFKSKAAIILLLIITTVAATADLWSKHAVFNSMIGDGSKHANAATHEAEFLKALKSPQVPPADSPEFTRIILQRLNIHRDVMPFVRFTISTNPGVVFGFNALHRSVVNLATIVMIIAVIVFFCLSGRKDHWLHVAFGLILGGAIGNLYDRLFSYVPLPGLTPIQNHVRDFIDCSEIGYKWVFNVADAWLVIGVAMIMLHTIWTWQKEIHAKKMNKV